MGCRHCKAPHWVLVPVHNFRLRHHTVQRRTVRHWVQRMVLADPDTSLQCIGHQLCSAKGAVAAVAATSASCFGVLNYCSFCP
jgi:hypothetical protein